MNYMKYEVNIMKSIHLSEYKRAELERKMRNRIFTESVEKKSKKKKKKEILDKIMEAPAPSETEKSEKRQKTVTDVRTECDEVTENECPDVPQPETDEMRLQKLREVMLLSEVLGAPVSRKRHRRRVNR